MDQLRAGLHQGVLLKGLRSCRNTIQAPPKLQGLGLTGQCCLESILLLPQRQDPSHTARGPPPLIVTLVTETGGLRTLSSLHLPMLILHVGWEANRLGPEAQA